VIYNYRLKNFALQIIASIHQTVPIQSQPKHRSPGGHNSPVGSRKSAEKVPRKALTRYPSTYVPQPSYVLIPDDRCPVVTGPPSPSLHDSVVSSSFDRQNCGPLMITDDQWFTELAALVIGVRVLPRQAKATGMESPLPRVFAMARLRSSFIIRLALL